MDAVLKDNHVDNYVECFGNLKIKDIICRKYCALRLKCAIERNEQKRMMQIEDLMDYQEVPLKIQ